MRIERFVVSLVAFGAAIYRYSEGDWIGVVVLVLVGLSPFVRWGILRVIASRERRNPLEVKHAANAESDLGPGDVPPPPENIGFDGKPIDTERTEDFEIDPNAIDNRTVSKDGEHYGGS